MSGIYKESLRAYFLAEHDKKCGIWRSKQYPDWVLRVFPSGGVEVWDETCGERWFWADPDDVAPSPTVAFSVLAEWREARLLPIPDEDGVYVVKGTSLDKGPLVFVRYAGGWRVSPETELEAEKVLEYHRKNGFTKLTEAGS